MLDETPQFVDFAQLDKRNQHFVSASGVISNTEHGVQTGDSFLEYVKMLDTEINAKGDTRPVVVLSDNQRVLGRARQMLVFCVLTRCGSTSSLWLLLLMIN
mmetsp:Transcript_16381/g.66204  ORF Transcript_16381/g.66204 Transcript_16381/m.66204 type:complete len:101 (+) Transcript_16381:5532-5834(+)